MSRKLKNTVTDASLYRSRSPHRRKGGETAWAAAITGTLIAAALAAAAAAHEPMASPEPFDLPVWLVKCDWHIPMRQSSPTIGNSPLVLTGGDPVCVPPANPDIHDAIPISRLIDRLGVSK